jgi:hypothetical protein
MLVNNALGAFIPLEVPLVEPLWPSPFMIEEGWDQI